MAKLYKLALGKKLKGSVVVENKEIDKDSILVKIRLREAKRRVTITESKIKKFNGSNKDLVKLKMILKK